MSARTRSTAFAASYSYPSGPISPAHGLGYRRAADDYANTICEPARPDQIDDIRHHGYRRRQQR
jgi:hypothetical protein